MKATLLTLALLSVSVVAVEGQQKEAVEAAKLVDNSVKVELRSSLQPKKVVRQLDKTAFSNKFGEKANAKIARAEGDVSAMYAIPEGTYFLGTTPMGYTSYYPTIVAPAFTNLEWGNYSTGDLTSIQWEYGITDASVGGDETKYFSDDVHLNVEYPEFAYSYMPLLTVSDGTNTSSYQRHWTGTPQGQSEEITLNGMINTVGYELDDDTEMFNGLTPQPFYEGSMTIGASQASNETWFGKNSLTTAQGITGYGLFVPKPASPLYVSHIYMHALETLDIDDNAQLRMDVYSAEGGKISISDENFIISAYCEAADIVNVDQTGESPYYYLPFYFMEEDGNGFLSPADFILDKDVFIVFSSFMSDDAVHTIDFPVSANVSSEGVTSYTGWILLEGGMLQIANMFEGVNYYTAPDISLCAYFGVLKLDSNSYMAPATGGTFTTNYQSNFMLDGADFTGDGLGEWYDYTYTEATQQNPVSTLQITVDPLPAGETSRSSVLNISLFGYTAQVTINQGQAGVEAVETSANRVSVVNGNFEVEAAGATSVDVYNVAGQKVASAAIEGTTVVPAQDLAKGLYILKFNDNTAVKVMK